jgi:hypothetical protein
MVLCVILWLQLGAILLQNCPKLVDKIFISQFPHGKVLFPHCDKALLEFLIELIDYDT